MPLYDYACSGCQAEFELLVRNGESLACPQCGSDKLERQLSAPAAHVAGATHSLPVEQNCGRPQCGRGCQFS